MKTLDAGLQAHYALGTTSIATCWKATLTNGTVVAATSHVRDIVFDSVTYQSLAAYNPSTIETGSELNPDNLELEGFLASPAITEADIHSGIWDYAAIEMFEVNYNDLTQGRNLVRSGTLGEVRSGEAKFTAELRGLTQAYSRRIVRLMQATCDADLGDARCKIDLEDHMQAFTVETVTDDYLVVNSSLIAPTDWFTGGKARFLTGANAGLEMEVKRSAGSQITLHQRMPFTVAAGDIFTVNPGCMKRATEDCQGKWNNLINFRGFRDLPGSSVYGGPGTVMTKTTGTIAPAPGPAPTPAPPASPGPAPAPSPAPIALPTDFYDATDYGAVGNGSTDNSAALVTAIAAAKAAGKALRIPAGVFAYSDVIHLDAVTIFGGGVSSILHSTDYENSAIFLEGSGSRVLNLKMTGAESPTRLAPWEATRITAFGSNWTIDSVFIEGSSAAGIQTAEGANNGLITNNTVRNTLADGIHISDAAHTIEVANNFVELTGDDGIAVVSYAGDTRCHTITAHHNIVQSNLWGRGMSVVGGDGITYRYNLIKDVTVAAGLYIAQETGALTTEGSDGILCEYNTIENCGDSSIGHAGVMIYSDGAEVVNDVHLLRNDIVQSGQDGIRYYGDLTAVVLEQNRISGAGNDYVGGVHAGVTITTYSSGDVGHVPAAAPAPAPSPAPSPGTMPSISTSGAYENVLLQTGEDDQAYWIEDNRWGQGSITSFTQEVGRSTAAQVGANGEVAARIKWDWPNPDGSNEVKAYPAIMYGRKPGYYSATNKPAGKSVLLLDGTYSSTTPSGWTPGTILPLQLPLTSLKVHTNHGWTSSPTGRGHLSFDIWLQSHSAQDSGFVNSSITHEIMIPLEHWGGYGSVSQRPASWYQGTFTSDGITFNVYKADNFGSLNGTYGRTSWRFVVFEAQDADMPIKQELTISNFVNWVRTNLPITGSEYLVDIGLGVEPEEGTGDLTIYDYRIYG